MTFRAPLIITAGPRGQPTDLLTWAQGLPPGIIANPVLPLRNYDWPNPSPLKTDAGINRTWIHVQQLIPPVVSPFAQWDWPDPTLGGIPGTELKTWTHTLPPGVIGNPVPLIAQTDWPNPAPPKPNLDLRTWWQSPAVPPFVALPFNQTDWPNPLPKAANLELRTWLNGLPTGQINQALPPNAQYDWPNPPPLPPNLELKSWIQTYSDQAPVPSPVTPSDTHDPLPRRRKRFDDSAQTQVIRESRLKPKKIRKTEVPAEQPAPIPIDTSAEDEDVSLLLADEDEQLTSLVELATHILRTLH